MFLGFIQIQGFCPLIAHKFNNKWFQNPINDKIYRVFYFANISNLHNVLTILFTKIEMNLKYYN